MRYLVLLFVLISSSAFAGEVACQITYTGKKADEYGNTTLFEKGATQITHGSVTDSKPFEMKYAKNSSVEAYLTVSQNKNGSIRHDLYILQGNYVEMVTYVDYPSYEAMPASTQLTLIYNKCVNCEEGDLPWLYYEHEYKAECTKP